LGEALSTHAQDAGAYHAQAALQLDNAKLLGGMDKLLHQLEQRELVYQLAHQLNRTLSDDLETFKQAFNSVEHDAQQTERGRASAEIEALSKENTELRNANVMLTEDRDCRCIEEDGTNRRLADAIDTASVLRAELCAVDSQRIWLEGELSKVTQDLQVLRVVKKRRGVKETAHQIVQTQPCAGSDRGSTPRALPEAVQLMLTLGLDFSAAGCEGSEEQEVFKHHVAADLAAATGLPPAQFCIMKLSPGSIILEIQILPNPSIISPEPKSIALHLKNQAALPTSPLFQGKLTIHTKCIEVIVVENNSVDVGLETQNRTLQEEVQNMKAQVAEHATNYAELELQQVMLQEELTALKAQNAQQQKEYFMLALNSSAHLQLEADFTFPPVESMRSVVECTEEHAELNARYPRVLSVTNLFALSSSLEGESKGASERGREGCDKEASAVLLAFSEDLAAAQRQPLLPPSGTYSHSARPQTSPNVLHQVATYEERRMLAGIYVSHRKVLSCLGDIQRHVLRIVGHTTDVVRVDIPPTSGGYIIWEEDMLNATGAGELTEVHPRAVACLPPTPSRHSQASLSLYGGESLLNAIELTDIVRKAHLLEGPVQHM
jgi:hypothetical protein